MPFRPGRCAIHPDVEEMYGALERAANAGRKPEAAVWKGFRAALSRIKADGQWGEVIPTSAIPAHFRRKYGATNLYCVDLASFRRCFYTIVNRDVVFLDIVDHATYDRWFGTNRR